MQDNILAGLGCSPGSLGHVAGGIDTHTAEQMVAHQCGVALPRYEGERYISLIDEVSLNRVWILRQLLHPLNVIDSMEFLLSKLKSTKSNREFLDSMNG